MNFTTGIGLSYAVNNASGGGGDWLLWVAYGMFAVIAAVVVVFGVVIYKDIRNTRRERKKGTMQ